MKRYPMLIMMVILTLSFVSMGCAPDLPKEIEETFFALGYEAGYSWGYELTAEKKDRTDLFWTPPDKVDYAQKLNPNVNIRDFFIPKGYWTMEDGNSDSFSILWVSIQ